MGLPSGVDVTRRSVGFPRRHKSFLTRKYMHYSTSTNILVRRANTSPRAMPSLTDHIDRLTSTMKSVKDSASAISEHNHSGPFTSAVLSVPLGDLIRDIDPSELGLFTLVPPPRVSTQSGPPQEVTRVEVVSATPLRKHPSAQRRDVLFPSKEPEPEIFAEAALKYIDR